jgi:hypothetical protein
LLVVARGRTPLRFSDKELLCLLGLLLYAAGAVAYLLVGQAFFAYLLVIFALLLPCGWVLRRARERDLVRERRRRRAARIAAYRRSWDETASDTSDRRLRADSGRVSRAA